MPRIELFPTGKVLEVSPGTPLKEILFNEGGEFPCGGNSRCRGCRIKLLDGQLPTTVADEKLLPEEALRAGWRLSCQAIAAPIKVCFSYAAGYPRIATREGCYRRGIANRRGALWHPLPSRADATERNDLGTFEEDTARGGDDSRGCDRRQHRDLFGRT